MGKYSRVHSYTYAGYKNKFRYNYETHELEEIFKPGKEFLSDMRNDPVFWKKELEQFDETGYVVSNHEPLREENWKESPDYWMDVMSEDSACLMAIGL